MIHEHTIAALMHGIFEDGVVAGALLAQVGEERVGDAAIDIVRDPHGR